MVWPRLALWLLSDPESGVLRLASSERTKAGIAGVIELYQRWVDGEKPSAEGWRSACAADAAYAAADAAGGDAGDARDNARKVHWSKVADKLIELMVSA